MKRTILTTFALMLFTAFFAAVYAATPLRETFEMLGFTVEWEADTSTAVLTSSSHIVCIPIGQSIFYTNGIAHELISPVQIINGRITLQTCAILESIGYVAPSHIPVLAYHSIVSRQFYYPINAYNPWVLLDETFEKQMRYLYDNGFTPLTVAQLETFLFYGGILPMQPVVLTFDDGYLDNYLFAAPIMRKFGFSGMMFLITDRIPEETPQMVAYPLPYMSPAEIDASKDVFEFGSHTHGMHGKVNNTPLLVSQTEQNIRADLRLSFEAPLTFTTGFAYPFGQHSQHAIRALQAEGIRFAFTTTPGYVERVTNPFLLPRLSIKADTTMEEFSRFVWG